MNARIAITLIRRTRIDLAEHTDLRGVDGNQRRGDSHDPYHGGTPGNQKAK